MTIGRGTDADIVIDNVAISRQHATLELRAGQYFLTDHYSLNGTLVNDQKIEATVAINASDKLQIGKFVLAPAPEGEDDESSSYSSSPDMNDDTIFISHKNKSKIQQPKPGKAQHRLVVLQGESEPKELYLTGKSSVKIGKDTSCDIVTMGGLAAGTQCFVVLKKDVYHVVPQKSWVGGTSINGKKIKEETSLHHGDIIEVGKVKIKFD
jgi:pSer/pThr/pTyr-binding forkhead associated (FHA) protein